MPMVSTSEAAERIAEEVERAGDAVLTEIYAELHPQEPTATPDAAELSQRVRSGLEAEELVALWNIVFPADRNVWYNEEDENIYFNEDAFGYAEAE